MATVKQLISDMHDAIDRMDTRLHIIESTLKNNESFYKSQVKKKDIAIKELKNRLAKNGISVKEK